MTKHDFLLSLEDRFAGLPRDEAEERLHFYSEMIDDRMEEGLSEEEAVAAVGSVDEVTADIPLAKVKPKRRLKGWEILLLALGSPIWLSLLIAAVAVVFSLYVALWSVIVSVWAVFVSVVACAPCSIAAGVGIVLTGNTLAGVGMMGIGLIFGGLAIFLFFGSKAATNGTWLLTKKLGYGLKNCFVKKEGV